MSQPGSSSEDDDVVVLNVCAKCGGIEDLQFDEEVYESYCSSCRALFVQTAKEGFRILLSEEDLALVLLIYSKLDKGGKNYWDYNDWCEFQRYTNHRSPVEIDSSEALAAFFKEEYDLELKPKEEKGFVIQLRDLENMYGGYAYNNIDALIDDSEALESQGIIDTAILE